MSPATKIAKLLFVAADVTGADAELEPNLGLTSSPGSSKNLKEDF